MKKWIMTAAVVFAADAAHALTLNCTNQTGQSLTAELNNRNAGSGAQTIDAEFNNNGTLVNFTGKQLQQLNVLLFSLKSSEGETGVVQFSKIVKPPGGGCKRCATALPDDQYSDAYWGKLEYGNQAFYMQCTPE
jgi:hypothetical protein